MCPGFFLFVASHLREQQDYRCSSRVGRAAAARRLAPISRGSTPSLASDFESHHFSQMSRAGPTGGVKLKSPAGGQCLQTQCRVSQVTVRIATQRERVQRQGAGDQDAVLWNSSSGQFFESE